jgi:hypothetical protein
LQRHGILSPGDIGGDVATCPTCWRCFIGLLLIICIPEISLTLPRLAGLIR